MRPRASWGGDPPLPLDMASSATIRPGEREYPVVAREGWGIIAVFVLAAAALTAIAGWLVGPVAGMATGVITGVLALWSIWFFRDPVRNVPREPEAVICPADGVCCFAGPAQPPAELGLAPAGEFRGVRVSIFMNVFNVHVNRAPVAGTVERLEYRPGKFFNASFDKASEHNERCGIVLRRADGVRIGCVQIAGLVARRIVWRIGIGDGLAGGERYGLIRFGSRVDVYLPEGIEPLVKVGEKTVAGETIIARLPVAAGATGVTIARSTVGAGAQGVEG